jgi:aminopeptidase N
MPRRLASAIAFALAVPACAFAAPTPANAPATIAPTTTGPAARAALPTTQLPRNVRPTAYAVDVTPHADTLTFDGRVVVDIEVLEPTSTIVLNAVDMRFGKVELRDGAGKPLQRAAAQVVLDDEAQTASFSFARPIAPGAYQLAMDYRGKIGTQANGLFAIDYTTPTGKKRALYTQFENSDARKFIPSWDEPAFRTPFALTATVPTAQMAVGNLPVLERKDLGNGLSRVRFGVSPKMSTYLLFFAVGDFERDIRISGKTELGVVTQRGAIDKARFALDSSDAILREYNDYFGVPFALPKLDNIASPGRSQFFGAMENWGAIFTFENTLLLDPAISTIGDRQRIFSVAAHEMAHQWFGDLVTMQWWDELWLNEGFASWMEGRTTQKLHPEWNGALDKVGVRESAMALDGIATTHPIVQHVETVEQASQAFDSITYSKGEAVIGMLEDYVGADAWREGVRLYMKRHAYSNTVSDDLWRAVEQASGKPITEVAHQFTLQPGVPMIRVGATRCVGGNTEVALAQGEFSKDRPDKAPLAWSVPVIARTVGNPVARTLVQGGKGTLTVPGCGTLVVNAGQNGYYRTLYDAPLRDAIREDFALLEPIDQLGLLNDSQALGMAGLQPASYVLDLAGATPPTAAPEVWSEIAGQLGDLDHLFEGDAAGQARVRKFAIGRLSPVLARLGWEARPDETSSTTLLRTRLITSLSALGDPQVIAEARRRFAARDTDPAALPVALRRTVLGIVARHADAATWDALHAMAKAETTAQVRDEYYGLLARAEDPALAKRALEMAIGDEPGETNSAAMLGAVADRHPDLAFDFAMAHLAVIDPKVDTTSRSRFYPGLARGSYDPAMIAKLRAYADKHVAAKSRRATDSAIAGIETSIRMRRDRRPELDAWLRKNG